MATIKPVSFTSLGSGYEAELQDIARRRAIAERLREQASTPIEQQTAGGWVVPISPWQGVAKITQGAMSGITAERATQKQKELQQKYQKDLADVLRRAQEATAGTPGTQAGFEYGGEAAQAPSPERAASIYMEHPATMPLGLAEIQRQVQARALRGAIEPLIQQQPAAQAGGPQPTGAPGVPGQPPGGFQAVDPVLLNLAAQPGASGLATLISNRQIAAQKSGLDWAKLQQARDEFNGLSAFQQATLARQGITDAIAYAKAKDEGVNLSGVLAPGQPQQAPAPGVQRPPAFPVETPRENMTAGARQLEILTAEAEQHRAQGEPVPPELEREIARAKARAGGAYPTAGGAAVSGLAPKQQREVAAAGAKKEAEERAKLKVEQPQAQRVVETVRQTLTRLRDSAKQVREHPGLPRITGIMGMAPNIPGGDAANAQALLNALKNQAFASALQAIRDASKTGGAVGQVSEKEGARLESMFASLENAQSAEQLKAELGKVITQMDQAIGTIEGEYRNTYGTGAHTRASDAAPEGINPKLWAVMTAEERAAFR